MVHNLTLGVWSTRSWTRINTFLSDAGSVAGAVRVDGALRSTVGRDSDIVREAGAGRHLPVHAVLTLGEGAAGGGVAGINVLLDDHVLLGQGHLDTVTEGVSGVSRRTLADGVVVDDLTPGVVATCSWTGVDTLLVDAGRELVTVRADHTLRPAVGRVALVAGDTGTHADSIDLPVLTVGAAGVWVAGVSWLDWRRRRDESTGGGGVSCVSRVAGADGIVVPHGALGVPPTGPGTGVTTLLLDTGQVVGTLSVDQTLRSAAHVRVSDVVLDTPAGSGSVPGGALCVGSAGRGIAGVDRVGSGDDLGQERAAREGVSGVLGGAGADGVVVDGGTPGVVPTGPDTGVGTLLLDTGLVTRTLSIEDTLRPTVGRGSDEARETGAGLVAVDLSALSVGTTRRGHTGDGRSLGDCSDLWEATAAVEWVSAVLARTGADRIVVDDLALGVSSTGARTGVHTPLLDTGHGQRTLRAKETLRPTVGRTSEVSLEAGADRARSLCPALAVRAAGVRVTGVHGLGGRS